MIKIQNLCFSYPEQDALCYNLEVGTGDKLWLHGPSGAGKTTLFKLMLGFMKPAEGKILIDGEELGAGNVYALRQKMSYVPQRPVLGRGKVVDIFQEIFSFKGNKHLEFEEEETTRYFEKFGLQPEMLQKNFEELSGGEQQRVSIILALLHNRQILLLDEAVSAIDQKQRRKILEHLAETDHTILLIAHDAPEVGAFREMPFEDIMKSTGKSNSF